MQSLNPVPPLHKCVRTLLYDGFSTHADKHKLMYANTFGDLTPVACVLSVGADGLFTVWMCCSLSPQSLWEQV